MSAADQLATMLGPEQMAALLGPSWKSRQPRMCQYCQRMFSNKFNLKQVHRRLSSFIICGQNVQKEVQLKTGAPLL
jgi:hypothetical protein